MRVIPEGVHPLLAGMLAPPTDLMACDVCTSAFSKCRRLLGVLLTQRGPLIAFALERVKSIGDGPARILGLLTGPRERHVGISTDPSNDCGPLPSIEIAMIELNRRYPA